MCNPRAKNTAKHEHSYTLICISDQQNVQVIFTVSWLIVDYSHFVEIRLRYSNRAVTYSNTAAGKADVL